MIIAVNKIDIYRVRYHCSTQVLFWWLFPSLLRNAGNKHRNNPRVSAETVRHSSTYIIIYMLYVTVCVGQSHGWWWCSFRMDSGTGRISNQTSWHSWSCWEPIRPSLSNICMFAGRMKSFLFRDDLRWLENSTLVRATICPILKNGLHVMIIGG